MWHRDGLTPLLGVASKEPTMTLRFHLTSILVPVFIAAPLVAGCSTPVAESSTENEPVPAASSDELSTPALQRRLEEAVRGVIYSSESDYPFTVVKAPLAPSATISAALLKTSFAQHPLVTSESPSPLTSMLHEEVAFASWFDNFVNSDDPPSDPGEIAQFEKRAKLRKLMKDNLTDLKVLRFTKAWDSGKVFIFVVGRAKNDTMMGVLTVSVET
jgi:hypothetical protein